MCRSKVKMLTKKNKQTDDVQNKLICDGILLFSNGSINVYLTILGMGASDFENWISAGLVTQQKLGITFPTTAYVTGRLWSVQWSTGLHQSRAFEEDSTSDRFSVSRWTSIGLSSSVSDEVRSLPDGVCSGVIGGVLFKSPSSILVHADVETLLSRSLRAFSASCLSMSTNKTIAKIILSS